MGSVDADRRWRHRQTPCWKKKLHEIRTSLPRRMANRVSTCLAEENSELCLNRMPSTSTDCSSEAKGGDRDVFNERPTREEQSTAVQVVEKPRASATTATIHTTKGDIFLKLYPDIAPKTVENFVTHIKNGYYNRIIFHRVIKKFVSLQCQFWLSEMAGV